MNYNDYQLDDMARQRDLSMSSAFSVLMRKVYIWMTLALVITGLTSYGVATSPGLLMTIMGNKALMWGMVIADLAIVIGVTGAINRLSLSTATLLFVLYSVINGAMLSSVFIVFTMSSIATVFFSTALTFGAMAFIGYTTKKDLTSMGRMLLMGLIGIIIASIVNIFVGSSALQMIVSYVGVVIFVGLTAYDSQKIKEMLMQTSCADETSQKLALLGALTLYLDFINLFLYLLRIFGDRRD